jgi:hypothetical protein
MMRAAANQAQRLWISATTVCAQLAGPLLITLADLGKYISDSDVGRSCRPGSPSPPTSRRHALPRPGDLMGVSRLRRGVFARATSRADGAVASRTHHRRYCGYMSDGNCTTAQIEGWCCRDHKSRSGMVTI